jgi:hypothetical protein
MLIFEPADHPPTLTHTLPVGVPLPPSVKRFIPTFPPPFARPIRPRLPTPVRPPCPFAPLSDTRRPLAHARVRSGVGIRGLAALTDGGQFHVYLHGPFLPRPHGLDRALTLPEPFPQPSRGT